MRTPQLVRRHAKVQFPGIGDLQVVIVHGDFHRAPRHRIIAVAERIGQRLAGRPRRVVRVILALHFSGHHAAGNMHMVGQKAFGMPE